MLRLQSTVVNFKDLVLGPDLTDEVEYEEDEEEEGSTPPQERTGSMGSMMLENSTEVGLCEEDATNKTAILKQQGKLLPKVPERSKLVIILVGLPGRGKTFLCNKLKCYLNWWVGLVCMVFQVHTCCMHRQEYMHSCIYHIRLTGRRF